MAGGVVVAARSGGVRGTVGEWRARVVILAAAVAGGAGVAIFEVGAMYVRVTWVHDCRAADFEYTTVPSDVTYAVFPLLGHSAYHPA